jgi:hypothetical protein
VEVFPTALFFGEGTVAIQKNDSNGHCSWYVIALPGTKSYLATPAASLYVIIGV